MATELRPDLCIIGAGSGGLSAAAAAAAFGIKVVLIEKAEMGGDCLNRGCVPSKALIAAAAHAEAMRTAGAFGISACMPEVDHGRLRQHIRSVIDEIAPNDSQARFTALGVKVIRAQARFADRRTVVAAAWRIRARRYIIATGSTPAIPAIPGLDTIDFLTTDDVFDLPARPEHLAVIGAGPAGIELAQAHARLGSRVTVLDTGEPLAGFDPELTRIALERLRMEGIDIRTGIHIERVEAMQSGGALLHLTGPDGTQTLPASHVLVAAGRRANLGGLDLEAASIAFGPEGIRVDSRLRTSNRRVHAIGDVVSGSGSTHLAAHHAGLVIRSILFRMNARHEPALVPRTVFTDPGIAQVGLSEALARQRHGRIEILRFPYSANDRAVAERRTSGLVKILLDRGGRILGAGIVGPDAAEQIAIWSLAMSRSMRIRDMIDHVLPYPTFAEAGKRAAMTHFMRYARKPLLRRLIRMLRLAG